MARHGCCYCAVESERHERPKPVRLRSVVESDLCSDAYWLALCIRASFEAGSKIVFNLLTSNSKNQSPFFKTRICQRFLPKGTRVTLTGFPALLPFLERPSPITHRIGDSRCGGVLPTGNFRRRDKQHSEAGCSRPGQGRQAP